jgi:hypothetical protein
MMPVRQAKKKPPRKSPNILAYRNTVRNHMAEERDTYEAPSRLPAQSGRDHAAQRKSWAEIAAAVGGSEWSARALVSGYRTSLAEPTGPAPSPTPCGAGL